MDAIQRFFFNIFLFCFGLGLFLLVKLDSYAFPAFSYTCVNGNPGYEQTYSVVFQETSSSTRFCLFVEPYVAGSPRYRVRLLSNDSSSLYLSVVSGGSNWPDSVTCSNAALGQPSGVYIKWPDNTSVLSALFEGVWSFSCNPSVRVFDDLELAYNYILTGEYPSPDFDSSLELDSFKVTSWNVGNLQALFKSKFDVIWSDSRISTVQVRILGTADEVTYESSFSPFKGKFQASQFVFEKGDVIHLVATPYKADGSYGQSLYYSVTYSDNIPFSNNYRKLVNNNTNNNTLTIPYSGTSGNDTVTLPVDGVTTNVTYKVNYNPVTNEYGDLTLYEIYYSPVVVYPDNTSDQEVDETQEEIINNYTTNNYYETTKNINLSFDIDFGDISTNDIGEGFNGVSGFFNGFGGFIGRLSNWILALFPFLPPIVANSIVFTFGLVIFIAGIALILKIIGAVGNIIDAILPL